MVRSILDAVKQGDWDYEPTMLLEEDYDPVDAMPGTPEKLEAMAERVARGEPLWHDEDRADMDAEAPRAALTSSSQRKPK